MTEHGAGNGRLGGRQKATMDAPRPTAPTARNALLDVLHGVAMLGVVVVDYPMFFRPVWTEFLPTRAFDTQGVDHAARLLITFLFQTKFLTFFSVLFGASFAILKERFARDEEFTLHYARRMTALFALGALQGVLLWYNSILVLLAGLGALALLAQRLPARARALAGAVLFLLGPIGGALTLGGCGGAGSGPYLYHVGYLVGWENKLYGGGGWGDITAFRSASFLTLTPPAFLLFGGRILALILLGSALYEERWFDDSPASRSRWAACLRWGLALGVPVQLVTLWAESVSEPSRAVLITRWLSLYFGSGGLAAAYMGGACIAFWSLPALARAAKPVAAAGRMCLTNFLLAMTAGSLLAYPYGAGLYGRVGTAAGAVIGLLLYSVLVAFSSLWLKRFRFGPFEWLLRAAAYRRLPALLDRPAPLRPAAASSRI